MSVIYPLTSPSPDLYEQDFYDWTRHTAELLRQRRFAELDLDNLIEEVESLGRSEKRELEARLNILLLHLLKYRYQPEWRCGSWRGSILEQRFRVQRLLADSPSLSRWLPELVTSEYPSARCKALYETGLFTLPDACPFTLEQVLDQEYWPEG